jgi:hypothetical protein
MRDGLARRPGGHRRIAGHWGAPVDSRRERTFIVPTLTSVLVRAHIAVNPAAEDHEVIRGIEAMGIGHPPTRPMTRVELHAAIRNGPVGGVRQSTGAFDGLRRHS